MGVVSDGERVKGETHILGQRHLDFGDHAIERSPENPAFILVLVMVEMDFLDLFEILLSLILALGSLFHAERLLQPVLRDQALACVVLGILAAVDHGLVLPIHLVQSAF